MKPSAPFSLLLLLPSIHAVALPHLIGSELESTGSTLKRDSSGKLVSRSSQPGEIPPKASHSVTDDLSLDPSSNVKQALSARSPQGPTSNPGEFNDPGLSRDNPINQPSFSDLVDGPRGGNPSQPPGRSVLESQDGQQPHHNSSGHHRWNATHHEHRKEEVLTAFNSHGEHIVVYNGTHYPNGTNYSPANETRGGGELLGEVVVAGDEVAVYRQPYNKTRHHHHNPTASGIWLPSGTGWIPAATGSPRHHRKVPRPGSAGFRGPKARMDEKLDREFEYYAKRIRAGGK